MISNLQLPIAHLAPPGAGAGQLANGNRKWALPRAFSLLEVLVALAIFALAAVVLGAAYVNMLLGYDAMTKRNEREETVRLMRAAVCSESDRQKLEEGGDLGLPGGGTARWVAKFEETTVADLFRVTLRCEIPEANQPKPWVSEQTFFLLRPTWSDPVIREKLRGEARERLAKREFQ
jgi:general secretion pathway protein I